MMDAFEDRYGVQVIHAWGMTELSRGALGKLKASLSLDAGQRRALQAKQGRVAVRHRHEDRRARTATNCPRDGRASGELMVRGPWVISAYFKGEGGDPLRRWLVPDRRRRDDRCRRVHADHRPQQGRHQVRRRVDRLDRPREHRDGPPGGGHGRVHRRRTTPKWDERPLLVVARKPGADVTREELLAFLDGRIAKWWTPDDVAFVAASARRHREGAEEPAARACSTLQSSDGLTKHRDDGVALAPVRRRAYLFPGEPACGVAAASASSIGSLRRTGDAVRAAARHGGELPVRRAVRPGYRRESTELAAAEWSSAAPPGSKRRRADPWRLLQSLSRSL